MYKKMLIYFFAFNPNQNHMIAYSIFSISLMSIFPSVPAISLSQFTI